MRSLAAFPGSGSFLAVQEVHTSPIPSKGLCGKQLSLGLYQAKEGLQSLLDSLCKQLCGQAITLLGLSQMQAIRLELHRTILESRMVVVWS